MFALLNINKPSGITSRRVVDRVDRLVKPAKAGHAGTLDPLASGVLVVCLGRATRLIEYVQRMPKSYRATFLLGRSSSTEDIEGVVTELVDPPRPSLEDIERVALGMQGPLEQMPPDFSAVKVAGRRAYALARAGQPVDLEPRTVMVHHISVVDYRYPQLDLDISCGSGTYVRTLGRELAERLGTSAVMAALERTAIGNFLLSDAIELERLSAENLQEHLISPLRAVEDLPRVALDDAQLKRVASGLPIACRAVADPATQEQRPGTPDAVGELAALDAQGNLVAILGRRGAEELFTLKYFPR